MISGTSICEEDKLELANSILDKAKQKNVELLLPVDNIVAKEYSNDSETKIATSGEIPDGYMGLDIGPETIQKFNEVLKNAKTVVWNGPMGVFEFPNFANRNLRNCKNIGKHKWNYNNWRRRLRTSCRTKWVSR